MNEETDDKYLDKIYEAYFESAKQFDKHILFIASGALGISFSFIKDIVNLNDAICNSILIISWIDLALVILLSLLSHYISKQALNEKLKLFYHAKQTKADKLNNIVKYLNISMIIMLVLGIILLVTFVGINI